MDEMGDANSRRTKVPQVRMAYGFAGGGAASGDCAEAASGLAGADAAGSAVIAEVVSRREGSIAGCVAAAALPDAVAGPGTGTLLDVGTLLDIDTLFRGAAGAPTMTDGCGQV